MVTPNSRKPPPLPEVRTQLVGPLLALLRARGHPPDALVRDFQLPPEAESLPELCMPLPRLRALLEAAERTSGDAFLGLHLAQSLQRGTYGIVEYIARATPTLRATFRALARYLTLLNDSWLATFQDEGPQGGTFTYGIPGEPLSYGRHANEFGLGLFVAVGRQLAGCRWAPRAVAFAHPAPPVDVAPLVEHFGVRPDFGAGLNTLTLEAAVLELPVLSADPALLSVLERAAGTPPSREPPSGPQDFVHRVREAIRACLDEGAPKIGAVARALHLSERTLQRRLAEHDTSFQDVVDGVRMALARQYLKDPQLGVSEVAFLLGYSEVSTFDRAFKRWTGMTPRAFRG